MIVKKKNEIVALNNIILGILGCITWFILYSCITIKNKSYINFTNDQENIIQIFVIAMAIPLIFTFIINLIYIFRNWHNKKSMLMNIFTIISIVTSIALMVIFKSYLFFYIISAVSLWGILILIFNKDEDEGKKHRTLLIIMILNIIIFIASSIGFLCVKGDFEIKYANNEKNLMKNIMQLSNTSNVIPIKAQKNGKWGYIDSNGNTIIDFNYDDCSEFIEIENLNTNKKYYIALVSFGNELEIITNNNKQIASYKNKKRETRVMSEYIPSDLTNTLKNNAKSLNVNINITKSKYNTIYESDYEIESKYNSNNNLEYSSDDNILSFAIPNKIGTWLELEYNKETESVTYNGRKVSIDGKLHIYKEDNERTFYDNYVIDTYENGYIPIYDFEKELFGWIDLKGQTHYISGRRQILDFCGNYIAVRDYSILDEAQIYIADYQGNRVSDFYKELNVLDKGYIAKKTNGKNVYLDENCKQITQEYDIIDACRIDDDILAVSNLYENTSYPLNTYNNDLNNLSFDLINIKNGQIIGKDFEYIGGMNNYKYNANYYDDLTNNEFIEILCSANCDYLNTKLYEEHYNNGWITIVD